jgi:hypothetical protein
MKEHGVIVEIIMLIVYSLIVLDLQQNKYDSSNLTDWNE